MRYKLLGRSGLRVSEICLGTMTFGEEWGFGANFDECKKQLAAFTDRGGNFIDTANKYTNGSSEKILGELVSGRRDEYVLATKYTLAMRQGDPNAAGNHRKNLCQAVNASLERLRTDYIDLYWVHAWDFTQRPDDLMRALDDVVRAGKVLHVGISDAPAWIVAQCNTIADLRGWSPFVGLQVEYSLIERSVERDLLPMAAAFDMAVTPWAPIGGGLLTGKYTREGAEPGDTKRGNDNRKTDRNFAIAREVDAVADELGVQSVQVAINWVRQKGANLVPIVGARTAEQLEGSLGATAFALGEQHMKRLDEASAIELGFPHDFIGVEGQAAEFIYGDRRDSVNWNQ